MLEKVKKGLGKMILASESAGKSWYKTGASEDIPVVDDHNPNDIKPLSRYSSVVRGLKTSNQIFLYVSPEKFAAAESKVREVTR